MIENIFFHGGGFYALCNYVGTIKQLYQEYKKSDSRISKDTKFYGNSAGAAAALACYMIFNNMMTVEYIEGIILGTNNVFDKLRPISFSLTHIYLDLADFIMNDWKEDFYKQLNGILHIGVTTKTGHKFIYNFKSNVEVYNAIMCSGTLVGLSTYESKIDGELCLDGGYTFSYKCLPDNTKILQGSARFPLSLTIPPYIIRQYLILEGFNYDEERYATNEIKQNSYSQYNDATISLLFQIYTILYKNPMWNLHIQMKTKSPGANLLNVSLFDIVDYIHNTIFNHRG
jgi:hypothetical protein